MHFSEKLVIIFPPHWIPIPEKYGSGKAAWENARTWEIPMVIWKYMG
jgi:hypothetical protein